MPLDVETLFLPYTKTLKYENAEQELAAVAAGQKAMSASCFSIHGIDGDDYFHDLTAIARRLGLTLVQVPVLHGDPRTHLVRVFVLKNDQLWRVPAYLALWEECPHAGWSDGLERFDSHLRGYTPEDITQWMAHLDASGQSFIGRTVYLVLSSDQARSFGRLSDRCLDPDAITSPVPVFHSKWHRKIRPDAWAQLAPDTVLARAVVCRNYFREIFARSQEDLPAASLGRDDIPCFNWALKSEIQPLQEAGWRAA